MTILGKIGGYGIGIYLLAVLCGTIIGVVGWP
jgi:hypothetical protein